MNARQRRGILLLVVSVLLALGAFAGVLAVVNDVESRVGPEVTAYELREDVDPYEEVTADQVLDEVLGSVAPPQLELGRAAPAAA